VGGNINTTKRNAEAQIDTNEEVGVEVKPERELSYMLVSHHQNAGPHHNINIVNRAFENLTGSNIWDDSKKSKFDS
jgi:hypothetical protein